MNKKGINVPHSKLENLLTSGALLSPFDGTLQDGRENVSAAMQLVE